MSCVRDAKESWLGGSVPVVSSVNTLQDLGRSSNRVPVDLGVAEVKSNSVFLGGGMTSIKTLLVICRVEYSLART